VKRGTKKGGTQTGRIRKKGKGNVTSIDGGRPFGGMNLSALFGSLHHEWDIPKPAPVKLLTAIPQKAVHRCIYVIDNGPDPLCTIKFVDRNSDNGHEISFEPKQLRAMAADFTRIATILAPFEKPTNVDQQCEEKW